MRRDEIDEMVAKELMLAMLEGFQEVEWGDMEVVISGPEGVAGRRTIPGLVATALWRKQCQMLMGTTAASTMPEGGVQ